MSTTRHTITALVQNEAGTLNRLVSMFRRRGFSLASLNAGDCEQPGFSRLTLVVTGDDDTLHQVVGQIEKLIDVVEVDDVRPEAAVLRELAVIQVAATVEQRREVIEIVNVFGGKVPHLSHSGMTVELTDEPLRIDRKSVV